MLFWFLDEFELTISWDEFVSALTKKYTNKEDLTKLFEQSQGRYEKVKNFVARMKDLGDNCEAGEKQLLSANQAMSMIWNKKPSE